MDTAFGNGIKYGVLSGLLSIIITVVLYVISPSMLLSWTASILGILVPIVFMFIAATATKKRNAGYLTFGQGFFSAYSTYIIASIIGVLFTYVLYNYIDPGLNALLKEYAVTSTIWMMELFGANADTIEQAIDQVQQEDVSFGLSQIIQGVLLTAIFIAPFFSVIIAAITYKKRRDVYGR